MTLLFNYTIRYSRFFEMALQYLQALPLEVRWMIYDLAFPKNKQVIICDPEDGTAFPALHRVPEPLHQELIDRYCHNSNFVFDVIHPKDPKETKVAAADVSHWLDLVGAKNLNATKQIGLREIKETATAFPWRNGHPDTPNSQTPLVYWGLDKGHFLDSGFNVRLTKEAPGFEIRVWYQTDAGAVRTYTVDEVLVNLLASTKYYTREKPSKWTVTGIKVEAKDIASRYASIKAIMSHQVSHGHGFTKESILRLLDAMQAPQCVLSERGVWRFEQLFSKFHFYTALNFDDSDKPSFDKSFSALDEAMFAIPKELSTSSTWFAKMMVEEPRAASQDC